MRQNKATHIYERSCAHMYKKYKKDRRRDRVSDDRLYVIDIFGVRFVDSSIPLARDTNDADDNLSRQETRHSRIALCRRSQTRVAGFARAPNSSRRRFRVTYKSTIRHWSVDSRVLESRHQVSFCSYYATTSEKSMHSFASSFSTVSFRNSVLIIFSRYSPQECIRRKRGV